MATEATRDLKFIQCKVFETEMWHETGDTIRACMDEGYRRGSVWFAGQLATFWSQSRSALTIGAVTYLNHRSKAWSI